MVHYHTQSFKNEWTLIRETQSSQKFRVETPDGVQLTVDVHYTPEKILNATIAIIGDASSKHILTPVMDDIGQLGLYRGDYAIIDYTLIEAKDIFDGNYSIDDKDRQHRKL